MILWEKPFNFHPCSLWYVTNRQSQPHNLLKFIVLTLFYSFKQFLKLNLSKLYHSFFFFCFCSISNVSYLLQYQFFVHNNKGSFRKMSFHILQLHNTATSCSIKHFFFCGCCGGCGGGSYGIMDGGRDDDDGMPTMTK